MTPQSETPPAQPVIFKFLGADGQVVHQTMDELEEPEFEAAVSKHEFVLPYRQQMYELASVGSQHDVPVFELKPTGRC